MSLLPFVPWTITDTGKILYSTGYSWVLQNPSGYRRIRQGQALLGILCSSLHELFISVSYVHFINMMLIEEAPEIPPPFTKGRQTISPSWIKGDGWA
jgi:hypothetical protein